MDLPVLGELFLLLERDGSHLVDAVDKFIPVKVFLDLKHRQDVSDRPFPRIRFWELTTTVPFDEHCVGLMTVFSVNTDDKTVDKAKIELLWNRPFNKLTSEAFIHITNRWRVLHRFRSEKFCFFCLELLKKFCK
ncbi:hypothetical protein LA6_006453 (plasmid) [Paracoccaceae bacterium]|nr:hypothetical protein LA6_006453 [Paracoccaceae bacterium]